MKLRRIRIAVGLLVGIASLLVVSDRCVKRECEAVLEAVAVVDCDTERSDEALDALLSRWEKSYRRLQLFVPRTELEEADSLIARLTAEYRLDTVEREADCAAISASIRRITRARFFVL